jgi:GTP-binding protein
VGKSSFINSIVRSERAIVSELAGTTRDAIDILYERSGRRFVFIDTAGIRRRGKHSTSVEVFSVMRAERSIRRADLCILIVDLTAGVTAQDKRIAGLMQAAHKPAIVILNKWDLVKPQRNQKEAIGKLVEAAREQIFFLDYAPVLIASSLTGEHVSKLFSLIEKIRRAARQHVGTGVLNRLLRQAFEANPPTTMRTRRLKLFYAAQSKGKEAQQLQPPEFVLFVNDPRLLSQTYKRYLESRIRDAQPFPGLPIILTLRPRAKSAPPASRLRAK